MKAQRGEKHATMFFVYVLIKPWDGEICYVGKGSYGRDKDHKTMGVKHYNGRLAKVFAKAEKLGQKIITRKVLYGFDEDEIFAAEKELIETLRFNGVDLCNVHDGGRWEFQYKWVKVKPEELDEESAEDQD